MSAIAYGRVAATCGTLAVGGARLAGGLGGGLVGGVGGATRREASARRHG